MSTFLLNFFEKYLHLLNEKLKMSITGITFHWMCSHSAKFIRNCVLLRWKWTFLQFLIFFKPFMFGKAFPNIPAVTTSLYCFSELCNFRKVPKDTYFLKNETYWISLLKKQMHKNFSEGCMKNSIFQRVTIILRKSIV